MRLEHASTNTWNGPIELLDAIGKLPSLKEVQFHSSELNELQLRALFSGLSERQSLSRFDIGASVAFDSKKTYAVLFELLAQQPNLKQLRIGRSRPTLREGNTSYIVMPLCALEEFIPSLNGLASLSLPAVENTEENEKGLASVARALDGMHTLEELSLSCYGSKCTPSPGFASLMQSVSRHSNLQRLHFSHSQMNEADASAMAKAVRDSQSLTSLDLKMTFAHRTPLVQGFLSGRVLS